MFGITRHCRVHAMTNQIEDLHSFQFSSERPSSPEGQVSWLFPFDIICI